MRFFKIMTNVRRGSVLFRYIASHLLVFFLPMSILSLFLYQHTVGNLRGEVMHSRVELSEQLSAEVDNRLRELNNVVSMMSGEAAWLPGNMRKGTTKALDALDRLMDYSILISLAEDICIYYGEQDYIFTVSGTVSPKTLVNNVYSFTPESAEEFFDVLKNSTGACQYRRLIQNDTPVGSEGNMVVAVYPMPLGSAAPYGSVLFFIRERTLMNMLTTQDGGEYVCVYDRAGRLMVCTGEEIEGLSDQPGVRILDDQYVESCVVSARTGWRYVTLVPTDQLLETVGRSRQQLVCEVMLCLALGLFCSLAMAVVNWRPIYELAQETGSAEGEAAEGSARNEVERIHSQMRRYDRHAGELQQRNSLLELTVTEQMPIVGQHRLLRLLRGRLTDEEKIEKTLEYLRMREENTAFFVMLLHVGGDALSEEPSQEDGPVLFARMDFADGRAVAIEDGDDGHGKRIAVLVNVWEAQNKVDGHARRLVHQVMTFMTLRYQDALSCGVGRMCAAAAQIGDSYIEAATALDFAMFRNRDGAQYFESMAAAEKDVCPLQTGKSRSALRLYVQNADREGALARLREYVDEIFDGRHPKDYIHFFMYELIGWMTELAREKGVSAAPDDIAALVQASSKAAFLQATQEFLGRIMDSAAPAAEDSGLLGKIRAYMLAHYRESTFSLAALSEAMNASQSYLSRYYKEMTGETMSHALTELRIKEIKRQLVQSDRSIREIVESVGYVDAANFSRKFKSLEGITLSDYRRLYTERGGKE